jgi:hypothetical protein
VGAAEPDGEEDEEASHFSSVIRIQWASVSTTRRRVRRGCSCRGKVRWLMAIFK